MKGIKSKAYVEAAEVALHVVDQQLQRQQIRHLRQLQPWQCI